MLSTDFHLAPSLRISGSVPLLPTMYPNCLDKISIFLPFMAVKECRLLPKLRWCVTQYWRRVVALPPPPPNSGVLNTNSRPPTRLHHPHSVLRWTAVSCHLVGDTEENFEKYENVCLPPTNSISRPVSMFGVVVVFCAGEAIRLAPRFFVRDTIVKYFDSFYLKNLVHSHFSCCTL